MKILLFVCNVKRSRKQESKEPLLSCLTGSTPQTIFFLQPSHHFLNYSFIKQRSPAMIKHASICTATICVCCRVFDVRQIWTWLHISLVDKEIWQTNTFSFISIFLQASLDLYGLLSRFVWFLDQNLKYWVHYSGEHTHTRTQTQTHIKAMFAAD